MNRLKRKYEMNRDFIILIAILMMSFLVVVSATKVFTYTLKGYLNTGAVDVDITAYEVCNGELVEATDKYVLPGEKLSYIPEVTSLREAGYVRVKVEIEMDDDTPNPITVDNVFTVCEDWLQKGDYFYCTKILGRGEKSDIFQGLSIPEDWANETASGFSIKMTADIIQSDNFNPDFQSEYPWGNVEIEIAKDDDQTNYRSAKPLSEKNVLEFDGVKGFECNTENLFRNFGTYMAGDEFADILKVKNSSNKSIDLYFRTDNVPSELLNQMKLTIRFDGKKLYQGNLASGQLDKWIKLSTLKPGEEQNLEYVIEFSEESQNYYSVLNDDITWMFKCTELENGIVKTGDETNALLWLSTSILASICLVYLVGIDRRQKRDEDN